jgi:hypothetical protein
MTITDRDLQEIQAHISPMLGLTAWNVALGVGSFLTLDFGNPVPKRPDQKRIYGEWHLWIYMCSWRLEAGDRILASCEDPRPEIESAIQPLEGNRLDAVEIFQPAWDTIFRFDQGITLRTFSIYSSQEEPWMLYTPNQGVVTVGPGTTWSYKNALTGQSMQ